MAKMISYICFIFTNTPDDSLPPENSCRVEQVLRNPIIFSINIDLLNFYIIYIYFLYKKMWKTIKIKMSGTLIPGFWFSTRSFLAVERDAGIPTFRTWNMTVCHIYRGILVDSFVRVK